LNNEINEIFDDLLFKHVKDLEKIFDDIKDDDEQFQHILSLLNYIKVRMDYIADITTGTPTIENTKSFRAEIIDSFLKNNLLLHTISGIDKFNYSIELFYKGDKLSANEDIHLAIPNDVLGFHAFYVILENLIRNTAKHGVINKGEPVVFQLKIDDINICPDFKYFTLAQEYYAVSIVIKAPIEVNAKKKQSIIENYYREHFNSVPPSNALEKFKAASGAAWIAFNQNDFLNRSILKNNQLRQGGWGIIEMEASAAYLRKIPKETIDKKEYKVEIFSENEAEFDNNTFYNTESDTLSILKSYVEKEKDKNGNVINEYLAYRFFIHKVRDILIVGTKAQVFTNPVEWDDKKNTWLEKGIKVIDEINEEAIYPHRLVVNYTGKELKNNANLSTLILQTPSERLDCLETDYNKIKKELWIEFRKGFRTERNKKGIKFLGLEELSYTSDHGQGYYQNISGNSNNNLSYLEIETSDNKRLTNKEIIEGWQKWEQEKWKISCNAKIKVIDERIQDFALNSRYPVIKSDDTISYLTIYKYTKILVPPTDDFMNQKDLNKDFDRNIIDHKDCTIDLNEQNFIESYKDIRKYIQMHNDIDFLVIHLGIIEKLISSYNNDESNAPYYDKEEPKSKDEKHYGVSEFIRNVLCKRENGETVIDYNKVIVISGRGKPHNLPDDIRFLNYSIVSQYLIDRRCKYAFAEVIHSARPFKNKSL